MTKRKVYKPQKLDREALRKYVQLHPDKTLKEIEQAFGASDAFVLYEIKQFRIIYKEITLYKNRDEEKQREFTKFLSKRSVKDLVFVNESGINHQDIKEYAWSEKGVKVIGERSGDVRHKQTTVIGGICCVKIIAPFYFDDYTNIDNFCL
jgi:hypothetical protein